MKILKKAVNTLVGLAVVSVALLGARVTQAADEIGVPPGNISFNTANLSAKFLTNGVSSTNDIKPEGKELFVTARTQFSSVGTSNALTHSFYAKHGVAVATNAFATLTADSLGLTNTVRYTNMTINALPEVRIITTVHGNSSGARATNSDLRWKSK